MIRQSVDQVIRRSGVLANSEWQVVENTRIVFLERSRPWRNEAAD